MMLSTHSINKLIKKGELKVEPKGVVEKSMIKLHLSRHIGKSDGNYKSVDDYNLKPKEFVVALSREKITLPNNLAALYDGHTHLARQGIITHLGSMFVYPGNSGKITFEIYNASDMEFRLKEGMRMGHLVFFQTK